MSIRRIVGVPATMALAVAGTMFGLSAPSGASNYPPTTLPPGLHAIHVNGFADVGQTVTLTITGTGFHGNNISITSNEPGLTATVVQDNGNSLVVKVTIPPNEPEGAHTFIITDGGKTTSVGFVVKATSVHADKTNGFVRAGSTKLVVVKGYGFYSKPTIKSNEPGTTADVIRDSGTLLVVRVHLDSGAHAGQYVFTITTANGKSTTVKYMVEA